MAYAFVIFVCQQIVTSLVADIITPIIALASGKNLEENFIILRHGDNATRSSVKKKIYSAVNLFLCSKVRSAIINRNATCGSTFAM